MQRTGFIVLVVFSFASLASAQTPSGNVFFGYSYVNKDLPSINRFNTNGWEASAEGKIIPFLGIVADFDGHYGSPSYPLCRPQPGSNIACGTPNPTISSNVSEHNYLFGPRASISLGKIRPFAQALFGGAHISAGNSFGSDTSFAAALGGGLDYKIIRPVALRVQGDYVQTQFFGKTQNNVRISTGIVLRF